MDHRASFGKTPFAVVRAGRRRRGPPDRYAVTPARPPPGPPSTRSPSGTGASSRRGRADPLTGSDPRDIRWRVAAAALQGRSVQSDAVLDNVPWAALTGPQKH